MVMGQYNTAKGLGEDVYLSPAMTSGGSLIFPADAPAPIIMQTGFEEFGSVMGGQEYEGAEEEPEPGWLESPLGMLGLVAAFYLGWRLYERQKRS